MWQQPHGREPLRSPAAWERQARSDHERSIARRHARRDRETVRLMPRAAGELGRWLAAGLALLACLYLLAVILGAVA